MAHDNVNRPATRGDETTKSSNPGRLILSAENLRKSYGEREALKGLTFSLQAGRILGFLGPNGAGKTTAIRILTTILQPDAGHFVIDGIPSEYPEQIRHRIGVLPETLGFHKQMSGIECLIFFGRLYGQTYAEAKANGEALLRDVGLDHRSRSLIGTYSRGMRQRLGIARALINAPAVVILDEPTLGLDPRGQQELLTIIRWIARERSTGVILCSHLLPEVESVCDDVVILSHGSVVARGTAAEVIGRNRPDAVQRTSIRVQVAPAFASQAQRAVEALPNVLRVTPGATPGWLSVALVTLADGAADPRVTNQITETLIRADIPILSFGAEGGRLQDVFLHLTEEGVGQEVIN
jgi:ABC-2 type transport system ATP-binding protein